MPKPMLIEEFHLQLHVAAKISPSHERAILQIVRSARFAHRPLRAAQTMKRAHRSLRPVRMTLSR